MEKVRFEDELLRKGSIVYRNKGTSMMPLIREDRDLMVIAARPDRRMKKYEAVLYKRGEKYILHRIMKVKKDGYVMCGDHLRKKEYGITDDMIIGVLSEIIRDGKTVSVTDKKYRLYVHLWCDLFYLRAFLLLVKEKTTHIKNKIKRSLKKENKDG